MMRDIILWFAVAIGPVAWFASFGSNWSLGWVCTPLKYILWAIALALTLAGAWMAWTQWQRAGRSLPGEAGGAIARTRAMALGGVLLNAASFLLILAQSMVSVLEAGACRQLG